MSDIIKNYDTSYDSKKIISQSILHQPAFIKEIEKYPDIIRNESEIYEDAMVLLPYLCKDNLIQLLNSFDPLDAVQFYRDKIKNKYGCLFRDINNDYFSESFNKFVDSDIILSPFTSYPINDPIRLLFERPFERLYDDVYLITASDYKCFIQRAYIVYSNFVEILFRGMRYLTSQEIDLLDYKIRELERQKDTTDLDYWDEEKDEEMTYLGEKMRSLYNIRSLDVVLKTSIFYWNIASNRIDSLYEKLNPEKKNLSGKYRICTKDRFLKVIDLETHENCQWRCKKCSIIAE